MLNLLNRPREYIQLHRDTTVQSLTLQPTVESGVIVYEDSPLGAVHVLLSRFYPNFIQIYPNFWKNPDLILILSRIHLIKSG